MHPNGGISLNLVALGVIFCGQRLPTSVCCKWANKEKPQRDKKNLFRTFNEQKGRLQAVRPERF
jgi:hypothetical protein